MFQKLVAMEPVSLVPWGEQELAQYARQVIQFEDVPSDNAEILARIGDADAVLLSYTSRLDASVMEKCPNLKYVGMCCSLYSKESANVDIAYAEEHGITVTGIRDYGDQGVVEYVLCELVGHLHGYHRPLWKDMPIELTGLKVGMVGMGVSGTMIAKALQFLGARVSYFCRAPKPPLEEQGMVYTPLHDLLKNCQVVFCCLNKNVLLLDAPALAALGDGKLLFNTSIGPAWAAPDIADWLKNPTNRLCTDTLGALGDPALARLDNVFCVNASAGRTAQAFELLSRKVLDNIKSYLSL